jgi:photosystem II stability/assembly factor-like uncharacterized protein
MKFKFGSLIVDGSGKIGGSVVTRNHYGTFSKTKVSPSNPQSSRQLAVRGNFLSVINAWENLSDSERLSWIYAAKDYPQKDKFGDLHILSGYGLFVKCNQVRLNLGLSLLNSFVSPAVFFDWSVIDIKCFSSTDNIWLFFSPIVPPGYSILIYSTALLSQGINYVKGQFRLIGYLSTGFDYPTDLYSLWNSVFASSLTTGKRLFFKFSIIDNASGFVSHSVIFKSDIIEGFQSSFGLNWSNLGQQFSQTSINCLADCGDGVIVAGTTNGGLIIRSPDYGLTWSVIGRLDVELNVNSLCYAGNGIVLAGTSNSGLMFRSIDFGLSWNPLGNMFSQTQISFITSFGNGVCYAGTGTGGLVLKSSDFGETWINLGRIYDATYVYSISLLPNNVLLAGCNGSSPVVLSYDNGVSWIDISYQFASGQSRSNAYLENGICLLAMTSPGRVARSINSGLNWEEIPNSFSQSSIVGLLYCGNGVCIAGASTGGLILISKDFGISWTSLGNQFSQSIVRGFIYIPDTALLCGTSASGLILRSTF